MKIRVAILAFTLISLFNIPVQATGPAQSPQKPFPQAGTQKAGQNISQKIRQKVASCRPLWQKMKRHDTNGQYHFPENPTSSSMLMISPQNTSANNFQ